MPVKFRDYYEVLGVARTAAADEIKKAYRRLARKHHPDVNPDDKTAEERFKEINEAYAVLSDSEKRRRYDQLGADWKNGADFTPPPGWQTHQVNMEDLGDIFNGEGAFSDFFTTLFGAARQRTRTGAGFAMKGRDVEAVLELDLVEAHRGVTRTITIEGAGVGGRRQLEVMIPAGVREGTVIRLAGQGGSGAGRAAAGDLHLQVKLRSDNMFTVVGEDDLQVELPIAPWEAVLGAGIRVPTLDGAVEMSIPPGTQNGQRLRLKGQGLNRRGGGRGDQYVRLKIMVPTKPTENERELFRKLAAESRFDPRD